MSDAVIPTEKQVSLPLKAIFGQKIGMTQIFDMQGHGIPVTVIHASPCHVTRVFNQQKNGYSALQIAFGEVKAKSLSKPYAGQFAKVGAAPARWIREIRLKKDGDHQAGQVITVEAFSPGDYVDVIGISKGHGFAGAMKRHNFAGGPSTHGQSDRARAPGSSGSNTYPGRVFKGKRFPGHFGVDRTTVQHLEIVKVMPEQNLLLIKGAVPGANLSLIEVRQTVKKLKKKIEVLAGDKKDKKKDAGKAAIAAGKAKGGK